MMIVRQSQMESLKSVAEDAFSRQMVAHVAQAAPHLARAAKESGVQSFVKEGIQNAGQLGFRAREPVRFFLDAALHLGHRFFTDPQYPWVPRVLHDTAVDTEDLRADLLCRHVRDYLKVVVGPGRSFVANACERLASALPASLEQIPPTGPDQLLRAVHMCYPEKFDYVGPGQLQLLIDHAEQTAFTAGFSQACAPSLLFLLMVSFGHGVTDDPLYPWVAESLAEPAQPEPQARLQRLYDRTLTYLRYVLAHLREG